MLSDDVETAQTVSIMDELATRDAGDRAVIDATHRALEDAGLDMSASPVEKAIAIFWYLKRTVRYVPTPGTSPLVDQTLVAPSTLLQMPDPWGDCPQFSMAAKAMLQVCCIPSMFKTIAAEPDYPDVYSHIYNVVPIGGKFLPFDSSNAPAPGAEYARAFKQRVWVPTIPDRCKETPMQRNATYTKRGWRSKTLRGTLGDDSDGLYDSDTIYSSDDVMTGPLPTSAQLNQPLYPLASSSSSSGASTTSLLTALANDAATVAAPIVKAATTQAPQWITNPVTGQSVLYNPNTGGLATGTSALGTMSPTVLIGAGVIVFALMAFSKK
jgi:hypothetical protein